jgi:hypothetical protein
MAKSKAAQSLTALFGGAQAKGVMSTASVNTLSATDLGEEIQNALGVSAQDIDASEVVLIGLEFDDSGSIAECNNEGHVRSGGNLILDSLGASKSSGDVLVMATRLNRGLIYPFRPLSDAERLSAANYSGSGGTPLFDRTASTLGAMLAKEQEFAAQGVPVRTVTVIITDGANNASRCTAAEVAVIVRDMRRRENHIIIGMGIDDGQTDFKAVFKEMGIDEKWVLTPKNTPSDIRRAFEVISRSTVQASQGAAAFSKANSTGIGKP